MTGVKLVLKALDLDSFEQVPGMYRVGATGSYRQIVAIEPGAQPDRFISS